VELEHAGPRVSSLVSVPWRLNVLGSECLRSWAGSQDLVLKAPEGDEGKEDEAIGADMASSLVWGKDSV
jgi:hypothetical protein